MNILSTFGCYPKVLSSGKKSIACSYRRYDPESQILAVSLRGTEPNEHAQRGMLRHDQGHCVFRGGTSFARASRSLPAVRESIDVALDSYLPIHLATDVPGFPNP
jgi:hypothetical protein